MARRVNTKFLIIFSVIVLGGMAGLTLLAGPFKNLLHPDRGRKLIEMGDRLVKESESAETTAARKEKLESAVANYRNAANTETKNPGLYVKLGDTFSKLTQFDVAIYINSSRQMWEKALEIDPRYLPALRRLQDSYYKEANIRLGASANTFGKLREKAAAIHAIEPNDVRAHALMYIAPLNQWVLDIETPITDVNAAIAELTTLIEQNPGAAELPDMVFFVASAKAKQAIDMKRGGQEAQGNDLLKVARQNFQDAIKVQEQNANMHYRCFQLEAYLLSNDRERDNVQRYSETMKAELQKARDLILPDDPNYVEVYVTASQVALTQRNPKRAEEVLLKLRANKPNDQRVRLQLAKFWRSDPSKLGEAIALLELPMVDAGWEGVQARQKFGLEVESLVELCNMYIEQYGTLPEGKRPEAMKQLDATFEKLATKAHDHSSVLKVRGKIERLRGGPEAAVKAVQTFDKAQKQFQAENGGKEDMDLTWNLAKAYYASRQSGEAKTQLLKLKERMPDYVPMRLMLAQLLIQEGSIKEARQDVEFLEKQAPEEPDVIRLVLAVLDPTTEAMKVKAYFERLPEESRVQRLSKAQVASIRPVSNPEEALRIYKLMLADDPADFEALQGARDILVAQNKKDEALALLKAGQAAKPTDDKIPLVIKQLEGASSQELILLSEQLIRKQNEKDPFGLELKLYEFYLIAGNKAEGFKHLQAAEQLKPDDGRVLDMMFAYHLNEQNWDKATEYVEKPNGLAAKSWDQAGGNIYRYQLAMARNDTAAATEIARELTTKLPEFARSWVYLARAYQSSQQFDSAISNYTVALEKQSENPEAIAGIIACYFQLNRPNEAFQYIEKGRKSHPGNTFFNDQWKSYQMQYGDASKVIKPVMDERDKNPKDAAKWVALGRAQYAAARKRDDNSAKYAADAKATFTEAVKRWPGEKIFWAFLSELADFNGDAAGGEAVVKEMIARPEFKDTPEPTMMLADHYLRHGNASAAEATMKQAVERFKDNVDVRRRLAAYYTQVATQPGDFDKALALLDPSSPDKLIRQQIVEIYMLAGARDKAGTKSEKFAQAEKLLRNLLAATPNDAQLHALLGVVLQNQNKEDQALESLSTALSIDPKNQAALFARGSLRLRGKAPQLEGATKDLVTLRDVNPSHLEARVALAEAYRQQRRLDEAAHELDEALRRAPFRRDIRVALVSVYAAMKPPAWSDAERYITEAERNEPREVAWKRMQAKLYSERQMHEKAALKIREALAVDAQNAKEIQGYQRNGELVRDYLDILESGKLYAQLLTETQSILSTDKAMADKGWWIYVKRAVAKRYLDQKQGAMSDFEKAIEIVQTDKDANQDVLIAIIDKIRLTLDPAAAIERARRLAEAGGPQAVRWKVVLAYLYYQDSQNDQATRLIEEARKQSDKLDERNVQSALSVGGTIFMMTGDFAKAKAWYEDLLTKKPDDLPALNNLACIEAEHQTPPNMTKAMEYSQRALDAMNKKSMNDANVLDTYGWVNVLSGDANLDRGIEYLNNSIKAGEIAEANYHLGKAYLKKKIPDAAKSSFTKAAQMLQDRKEKGEPVDQALKKKIEDALVEVEGIVGGPRAGNP